MAAKNGCLHLSEEQVEQMSLQLVVITRQLAEEEATTRTADEEETLDGPTNWTIN